MPRAYLLCLALVILFLPSTVGAEDARQAPGASLQERINAAAPGETVFVEGGVYRENVVIDKPLSLIGVDSPVIEGGGQGDVVTISADDVSISRFTIRGSSRNISQEPAAIKISEADRVTIRANRLEDSHFGVHMTSSADSTISDNVLDLGGHVPEERRGHGIYLWEVSNTAIHANVIRHAADGIHLEFSEDNGIGDNTVTDSRYALHFMYASGNKIINNTFRDNLAGAVLMFSHDLLLKDNELSNNRRGATGAGILLKDADNVFVEGNLITRNKYGMTVDGTPQSVGATAVFIRNLFALNDTGLGLMSNAPITFVDNAMIENTVQVKALGGDIGSRIMSTHGAGAHDQGARGGAPTEPPKPPKGAVWTADGRGNYWSDYNGYDANGDGVGDRPYLPQPPFAGALDDNDTLRLFQFTLAQQAIDMAADMFPVYDYQPIIEDSGPLMDPPGPALPRGDGVNEGLLVVSALLLVLSGAVLQSILDIDTGRIISRIIPRTARGPAG
jgi:nitrous oxidase accessory protein